MSIGLVRSSLSSILKKRSTPLITNVTSRQFAAYVSADGQALWAGCVVERRPDIYPQLQPWEVKYASFTECRQVRVEKGDLPEEIMAQKIINPLADFKPGNKKTIDDFKNNRKSRRRALDQKLYLIFKRNGQWEFPSAEIPESKSVKEAALREINKAAGPQFTVWYPGPAPMGVLQSADKQTFMMWCNHIDGEVDMQENSPYEDYAWVTKKEIITEYFVDPATNAPNDLGELCKEILINTRE